MLRLLSHVAHLLAEAVLGVLALAALAVCVLAWRLGQGPLDITALLHREPALLEARGARVSVGQASVELDRLGMTGAVLLVAGQDVAVAADGDGLSGRLGRVRVSLSVPQLLLGRVRPRVVDVEGGEVEWQARATAPPAGSGPVSAHPPASGAAPPAAAHSDAAPDWLAGVRRVRVQDVRLALRGLAPGLDVAASRVDAELERSAAGEIGGHARLDVQAGAARSTLDVQAAPALGGTRLVVAATPVSPASLAGLLPALAPLAAADLPVGVHAQATLDAGFHLRDARVELAGGAGALRSGTSSVAVTSLAATLSLAPPALRLDALRIALAPAGTHGPPPVITGSAAATRAGGRVHANFAVALDAVALADLPLYWPEGVAADPRSWLAQNVTAGRAHDADMRGSLDAADDLSGLGLTALSGGLQADDVSVTWLRPVPGLVHGRARLVLDGPDTLRVTMDRGEDEGLTLAPGSAIRITGLSSARQFGDIAVSLSGTLPAALGLLNHPRLHLLASSGLQVVGAAGQVAARLTLHLPLENGVTVEQIAIAADATLSGVHLGRIAAGRDLDDAEAKLHVTGDGLSASGTGQVGGIPARLGLTMDFRAGGPDQMVQHVTAAGSATVAQLGQAGLPDGAVHLMTGGQAGLRVDYTGRRDGRAALQLDADLTQAALGTPVGWTKQAGQPAALGGLVLLEGGRLSGLEHLHAEGPGLAIVSRSQVSGATRTLLLDRLEVGATRAHGQIGFSAAPGAPVRVRLAGAMLDLSSQLDAAPAGSGAAGPGAAQAGSGGSQAASSESAAPGGSGPGAAKSGPAKPGTAKPGTAKPGTAAPDDAAEVRGQAWTANLAFAQVGLSRGRTLAPFVLDAASDGLRILHAHASAGGPGELAADITPAPGGRRLAIQAADAGAALRALGLADNLAGGRLVLDGRYDDTQPGAPLSGTATLTGFNLRTAPAIGRLLQAMTLYGLVDVLHGPGLHFSRLVAPFGWRGRVLHLANARAFSPSLGLTAQGDIDLRQKTADVKGTVVPAYFFNQLLGDLPVIGRVFSPEKGGGVFAARYSVRGPLGDLKVGVNPLAALTPGFLREGFGLFSPRARK